MAEKSVVPGLKAAMRTAGFTQKTLADEMQVSISTVARWSNGEIEPTITTAKQICEILDVSLLDLLGIQGEGASQIIRVKKNVGEKIIVEITD